MLRQQEAAATSSAWQILQIAPTSIPGMHSSSCNPDKHSVVIGRSARLQSVLTMASRS